MRAREIVLALFIILAGISLTAVKSGRLHLGEGDFFGWSGQEFRYEESRDIPGPVPARIEVANARGFVTIEAAETDTVKVVFSKHLWRKNEAEAKAAAAGLRLTVTQSEDRLILSAGAADGSAKRFETGLKLIIPSSTSVLVKNAYGPVRAAGLAGAELINSHGSVSAARIAGTLVVRTSYEPVDVDGIGGDCRIEASHGEVNVRSVSGDLLVENSYEKIRVEDAAKALTVSGNHSDVLVKNVGGRAEIGSSYEPIKVVGAADIRVRGLQCDIELEDIRGAADVADDHGSLRVKNIAGGLKVEGRDLGVWAAEIGGPEIRISTSYQDVDLLDFSGPVVIVLNHGDLRLRPKDLSGTVDVQGSYAAVDIEWPAGLRAPLSARTVSGEIDWRLTEKPASQSANGSSEVTAFPEAAGRPGLTIVTSYGDVTVRPAGSRSDENTGADADGE